MSALLLWGSFSDEQICRYLCPCPVRPQPHSPLLSWEGRCPLGKWATGDSWTLLLQVFSSERLQDKKSWVQAQGACQELGARLLSLASYEEEHFVADMLNKIFGYGAWGGGLCVCVGDSWLCKAG